MNDNDLPLYDLLLDTKKVPSSSGKQRSFRLPKEIDAEVSKLANGLGSTYNIKVTQAHMLRVLVILSLNRIKQMSKVVNMMSIVNDEEDTTLPAPVLPPEEDPDLEEQYVLNLLQQGPMTSTEEWDPQG